MSYDPARDFFESLTASVPFVPSVRVSACPPKDAETLADVVGRIAYDVSPGHDLVRREDATMGDREES